jgi:hypothetical protein
MPRPYHPSRLDHPNKTCWIMQVMTSLCSLLHPPAPSSLSGPNILLSTLFSNTLSLCSSLILRDQVSLWFCVFNLFKFLKRGRDDKRLTEC